MNYYYTLGYKDWNFDYKTTLSHNQKFTKKEFDKMVLESYSLAYRKILTYQKEFNEELKKDYYDLPNASRNDYKISIVELNNECLDFMIKKYGFTELNLETEFMPQNSYDILESKTKEKNNDKDLLSVINRITLECRNLKIENILKIPNAY